MTGGFGSSNGFKDGVRYMMKADIDKVAHGSGEWRLQHQLRTVLDEGLDE
jgi:hypothetical protein